MTGHELRSIKFNNPEKNLLLLNTISNPAAVTLSPSDISVPPTYSIVRTTAATRPLKRKKAAGFIEFDIEKYIFYDILLAC